jgi:YbbR domain-containing protein
MPTRRPLRRPLLVRLATENLGLKVLSVVAAVVLFSVVHGAGDLQRGVWVDVVTLLPPESSSKLLLSELPDQVRLTVRGRRALVQSLGRDPIAPVQLDLRDTARRYYAFDPDQFELPAGISIVQIVPEVIELHWADKAERRLPIVPTLVGVPPSGLELRGRARVEPAEMRVVGPAETVERLTELPTEAVDIARLGVGLQDVRVPLRAPPEHVRFADGAPVRVLLELLPKLERRTLRRVQVSAVGGGERVDLRPARVDVVVEGPVAAVADVDIDTVIATVDASATPASGAMRAVEVRGLPEGVQLVSVTPSEVLVHGR